MGSSVSRFASPPRRRAGYEVKLLVPTDESVANYLTRMHLPEIVDRFGVRVDRAFPSVNERDQRDNLVELRIFVDIRGTDELAQFISMRLQGEVGQASRRPWSRRRRSSVRTSFTTRGQRPAGSLQRNASEPVKPTSASSSRSATPASASGSRSGICMAT